MTELVLYGHPDSGHACKIALALSLAGLDHRTVWIDIWAAPETRDPAFLKSSPFAEVPLLTIDGTAFTQSGAILLEIAQRFSCLGGQSQQGLQRGREILMWEANRLGMCVPQLKEARRVNNEGFPAGALQWLRARYDVDLANFTRLLGEAPFLHGNEPGIGDCAVWGYSQWLDAAGLPANAAMDSWLARMRNLDAMKTPAQYFPKC